MFYIMAAMSNNNVIGKNNQLPWSLPEDLKMFKKVTSGKKIVMGRKTFESLPGILPNREHLVLTRSEFNIEHPQVKVFNSIDEIINYCDPMDSVYVIGGSEIFKQFMPLVNKMFITIIRHDFEGDTYFPEIKQSEWEATSWTRGIKDEKNPYDYFFKVYQRNK